MSYKYPYRPNLVQHLVPGDSERRLTLLHGYWHMFKRNQGIWTTFVGLTNPNLLIIVLLINKIIDIGLIVIHFGQTILIFNTYGEQTFGVDL